MKQYIAALILIVTVVISSCSREFIPPEDVELGKEYYPIHQNHMVEYQVDSIIYNDFTETTDTFNMQFRDEFADEFMDNQQRPSRVVHRYYRQDSTYEWVDLMTYYVTQTSFRTEVVENNFRFMKMVYPVKINTRWFGNSLIPTNVNLEFQWLKEWEYKYQNVNEGFDNGLRFFPATVTILQADDVEGNPNSPNDFSAYTFSKEVYAKGVGLVYKELTRWEYQPQVKKYKKGFTLIMRAIKHA